MKATITISRIIVGILFIFSGLIKANDPLGLSYKMQEFFEIWGWHALNDYTLAFSILMIAFEIIAGVAVLLGWSMPLFSWLLLLLTLFFTFLTGYALFSGKIKECGCFGDCIPLSAQQSFIKDLVLLALIVLIFANRRKIRTALPASASMGILALTTIFSFGLQWYVMNHLPVVDCLPYRVGKNISEQMKIPPGAVPDSTVINFVYDKKGKQIEFTADQFPEDFNDSIYRFIRRYDKVLRKGNAVSAIKDFVLITADGNDTTQAVLAYPGYQVLIFTKGLTGRPEWTGSFKTLYEQLMSNNIKVNWVTSNYDLVALWAEKSAGIQDKLTIFKCDYVAIKTAARADPTLYLIKQGTIHEKWSYVDIGEAISYTKGLKQVPGGL
ncbi:MAG: BT_3928 family protein [Chitinophagaceae bacterium]